MFANFPLLLSPTLAQAGAAVSRINLKQFCRLCLTPEFGGGPYSVLSFDRSQNLISTFIVLTDDIILIT